MVRRDIRRKAVKTIKDELSTLSLSLGDVKRVSEKSFTFTLIYNKNGVKYGVGEITVNSNKDVVNYTPVKYLNINIQRIEDGSIRV